MLFSSPEFTLVFLPLAWVAATLLLRAGDSAAQAALIAASLVYYGAYETDHLPLLLGLIVVSFLSARRIERTGRRRELGLAVAVPLGALAVYKYATLFSTTLHGWWDSIPVFEAVAVLPLGISFFSFQIVAFLVDTYRGRTRADSLPRYGLFVMFFPQLVAGPIVHYQHIGPQLRAQTLRRQRDIARGLFLFGLGLCLKTLLADRLAPHVDAVYDAPELGSAASVGFATLAYTLQIYFDFHGYGVMAVGLGLLFGVRLPFNFDSPYRAASIIDFWRRWNITLSQFLRDYLYIPLGGNRKGRARRYANLMITMLLGGLWHGADWAFAVWGGLHGAYLMAAHAARAAGVRVPGWLSRPLTLLAVAFAWIFFRAESLHRAREVLERLGAIFSEPFAGPAWDLAGLLALGWGIALAAPNAIRLSERFRPTPAWILAAALLLATGVLNLLYTGEVHEFIYFRF